MDTIAIKGMVFFGYHGHYAEERSLGQRFVVDVEMGLDTRPAGLSDDLNDSVDYGRAYEEARAVLEGPPCKLLERVAEQVAERVLALPHVQHVTVSLHKPGSPLKGAISDVCLTITRP